VRKVEELGGSVPGVEPGPEFGPGGGDPAPGDG
jgi:hypothetical protein